MQYDNITWKVQGKKIQGNFSLPRVWNRTNRQSTSKHIHNLMKESVTDNMPIITASFLVLIRLAWVFTFIGRSKPDEEVCRQTPRSADPAIIALSQLCLKSKVRAVRVKTQMSKQILTYQEVKGNPQLIATWYEKLHVWGEVYLFFLHIFPSRGPYLHASSTASIQVKII